MDERTLTIPTNHHYTVTTKAGPFLGVYSADEAGRHIHVLLTSVQLSNTLTRMDNRRLYGVSIIYDPDEHMQDTGSGGLSFE